MYYMTIALANVRETAMYIIGKVITMPKLLVYSDTCLKTT